MSNLIKNGSLLITEKTIDVRQLIVDRNPRLLKIIPGFVLRYLEKILHVDEVNDFLWKNKDLIGLDFVRAVMDYFHIQLDVIGEEHIAHNKRFIVAANHPMGGLDGLALMMVVGKYHPNIVFPVNDFLLYLPQLKPLFIPINKIGSQSIENVRKLEEVFQSDKEILYFPSGLASRKIKGEIVDLEWKKTFIQKARKFNRKIIPTFITGRNSNRFYRLANWRKRLGIKFNIEMIYLPDEMFRQKEKHFTLIFGKPIHPEFFDESRSDKEWAAYVKQIVYQLKQ
ncbi:MAG: 1-acyl-sn-glycerol-3-phosphate acyltransferase [Bacteroidales bacterium]|nr:1-acyl-sn-glycerol-3-phosphate acyltransferase [Bacteroidales bacterium]